MALSQLCIAAQSIAVTVTLLQPDSIVNATCIIVLCYFIIYLLPGHTHDVKTRKKEKSGL